MSNPVCMLFDKYTLGVLAPQINGNPNVCSSAGPSYTNTSKLHITGPFWGESLPIGAPPRKVSLCGNHFQAMTLPWLQLTRLVRQIDIYKLCTSGYLYLIWSLPANLRPIKHALLPTYCYGFQTHDVFPVLYVPLKYIFCFGLLSLSPVFYSVTLKAL